MCTNYEGEEELYMAAENSGGTQNFCEAQKTGELLLLLLLLLLY